MSNLTREIRQWQAMSPDELIDADVVPRSCIEVRDGHAYLFLVTDLYSRKIVGYHLSRSLMHHGAVHALKMALKGIKNPAGTIHHSDRGCQYCCHEFLAELDAEGLLSSMTADSHCYENAVAERVNGIL